MHFCVKYAERYSFLKVGQPTTFGFPINHFVSMLQKLPGIASNKRGFEGEMTALLVQRG